MLTQYNRRNIARRNYGPIVAAPVGAAIATKQIYDMARSTYNYVNKKPSVKKQAKSLVRQSKKTKRLRREYKKESRKAKPLPRLKKEVSELKRQAASSEGKLVYRTRACNRLISTGASVRSVANYLHLDNSTIEAALAQLRYYDPTAPTALVTADGASGSYRKEFNIKRAYSKLTCRNNYQVPCELHIWCCRPKDDTSLTPSGAWSNGMTDGSNATSASNLAYPSDSNQFKDLFRIESHQNVMLQPGEQVSAVMSSDSFYYDPAFVDTHADAYQPRYKSGLYLISITGVLSHDSVVATEQGRSLAGIDIEVSTTVEIRYDAGADIEYVYISDTSDTFTNGAVSSNMPVSDNQSYSLA